jgi:hypothetical protein
MVGVGGSPEGASDDFLPWRLADVRISAQTLWLATSWSGQHGRPAPK